MTTPRHRPLRTAADRRLAAALPTAPAARVGRLLRRALALSDSRYPWERALWFTRGFRATDPSEPMILRRAQALRYTLEHVPIRLRADDYLAGDALRALAGPPGVADEHAWTSGVTAPESWLRCDPQHVPADVARELAWWDTQRLSPPWQGTATEGPLQQLIQEGVIESPKSYFGHVIPYFETALTKGYAGIRAEARTRLAALSPADETVAAQRNFYRAIALVCQGAIAFGARYAAKARALAARTRQPLPRLVAAAA